MPNSLQGTAVINHEGESAEVIGILPLNITESTILVTDCNNVAIDNWVIENPYAGLSTEERELLDPVKRQLASSNILESVRNGSKLSLPVINIFSHLFEDTNIEATTRVNSARVLSIASQDHSSLMAKLDYHLDDENITIQKIIMNRFILSGYPFQNIQAIEKALYIPALKDFALHVLNRSADCKNKMHLQDTTISHLNQLLDDTGERRNLSMRILANRPQDLITNFEALHQILLTGDNETKCWIYKILENVANAGKPIASKILDEFSKISGNHYAALKDREAGLRILERQIANNISELGWFDYLSNNLQDENQSIASKSLKILKISLERRIKLPDNILDSLVNSSPIFLQNRQTKDDINYCLNFIDKLKQQQSNSELTKDGVSTEDINQQPDDLSTENSSQEKDLESFLGEIETLNKNNPTIADSLLTNKLLETKFLEILSAYDHDSNLTPLGKKISQWQRDDITNWSNNLLQNQSKAVDDNFLPEMMAVIKRANLIDTNNDPRFAQMLSILMLLLHQPDKGRLIQVATGEGKSTTSAMLAVVLALRGEKVDIITSSQVLAQRDALERKEFFAMFNLKVDHNTGEEKGKLPWYCYSANVVYGDVANFQADLLRDEYKAYQTRGDRPFNSVIIDEVDSMLIDDNSKLVRLAGHIAGMEYLETLLAAIWSELGRLNNHLIYSAEQQSYYFIQGAFKYENGELTLFNNENGEESVAYPINDASLFCKEHIEYYIRQIIEQKSVFIPEYLQEFTISQIENWAEAAINAKNMTENKDYVIKDKSGYSVIAPVDYYNTGIVQDKTSWQNGLQQFLQLKHALRLTAENFTTCFISNMEYFLRYGCKIYGMTGTLGSHDAQDLLSSIYPVDLAVVPTYKPKQFVELTGILAHNSEEWLAKVGNSIIEETSKNRAVLVICQTISDVYKVKDSLLKSSYPSGKIKLYSRNDNDEYLAVGTSIEAGQVIIATNLAGRGTDVKTAKEVEVAGGLHVCLTFLPDNLRVEEQAFGRTSRQGNHGSGQLIIDQSELETKFGSEVNFIDNIAYLKNFRDIIEHNKLEKVKTSGADKIRRNDRLFNDFCKFTNELRNSNDNEFKLAQLEELWGIKLKQISEQCRKLEKTGCNSAIEEYAFKELNNFKAEMRVQYSNGYSIMRNPAYLVREGVNKLGEGNRYQQSIDLFDMAINLDASYSFAGYYNRAYAKISQGYTLSMQSGKFDTSLQASAYSDLMAAKAQIESVIIPGLVSIQVISNHKPDSELSKQIRTKINLLKEQINYIESAAKTIENCKNGCITQVSNRILLPDLFTSDVPDDAILELNMFGILQLFELDTVEPESSIFDGLLVAALGVAQIFVGALCVVAGQYKWGTDFITEGLQDLYKSINAIQSGHFNWNNYWTEKGITLAVTLAMMGCENLAGKLGATKTLTKEGVKVGVKEEAKKLTTQELVKQAIKESAIKTVVNIGIDYAATGLSKAAVNEFKDEIRDIVNNKISNCLLSEYMVRSLSHIMMVDDFNHNAKGQNAINQGVADILTSKRNIIGEIASKLLTSLSHSNYTTVKVMAYAARATNTAHDVSKLQDFADSFCQSLEGKIRYIESSLPSLDELLYSSSNPVISMDDAADIVKTLERIGAINNNQFCSNAVEIIKQNQLGVGEKYRAKISSFASRMIASSAKDYKSAINHLITQQSARVSKSLMSHYQHQLANPIIQEGMQQISLSDKISDTLLSDSYRLNDAIRDIQSRNAHKVINLASSKRVAIAAGDDDGTIMMHGKNKSSNSEPALKLDPHNTNVQLGLTIGQPQKLDKSLFGTGEESAQGTSRQLGTVDSIGNGHHPELVSGYRPITAADIGFAGLTSADLALASLLPKPGSGDGGSNSILLLSSAMQQPIYVFENGKFLQSYGKTLGGTPITIGYDSKNQQYFGFTNKGPSNSGNIFEAISASSNGKYSADILRGVVQPIPIADTTPLKPPSQPTPQPKPLSQSELSAAQFLVDTLTVDKQQLQAKENEYHRALLQIAKQNIHDAAAKKSARDEALMQQAYAIGGEMGSIPKLVKPMEGRKTTADTDRNISEYFDNPNNKYANNQIIKGVAQAGEVIEWASSNLAYGISHVEGGRETLLAVGTVVGGVVDGVKNVAKGAAKVILPSDVYENAAKNYNELPRGAKIATESVGDWGILGSLGKLTKFAGGKVINAFTFKGAAAEDSVLRSVSGASEISTGLGKTPESLLSGETSLLKATGGNVLKPSTVSIISGSGADKILTNTGSSTSNVASKLTPAITVESALFKNMGTGVAAETTVEKAGHIVKVDTAVPTVVWNNQAKLTRVGSNPYTGVSADFGQFWKTPTVELDIGKPSVIALVEGNAVSKPTVLSESANVNLVADPPPMPTAKVKIPEVVMAEIESFAAKHNWHNLPEMIKYVPEGYSFAGYPKGDNTIGVVFKNGPHNKIIFKKAKPMADYPSQHDDYVSYIKNGNQHVTRDGGFIYEHKGNMIRADKASQKTIIPKEELQRLGIETCEYHPDVHIPWDEFIKMEKK